MEQDKPVIQFSHANGFPGSCYQQLYINLRDNYQVDYIDTYAVGDEYKVTDNWDELVDQLVERVKQHDNPVVAVGHSLGGVLSLMAACRAPEYISQVIMLDAPYFSWPKRFGIKLMKLLDKTHILTPGGRNVLSRKREWQNTEEIIEYARGKDLFNGFTEECISDWAKYATQEIGGKRRLKIDPEIEYSIYGTLPHIGIPKSTLNKIRVAAVIGKETKVIDKLDVLAMRYMYGFEVFEIDGGHMFPFQYPDESAKLVHRIISNSINI